MKYICMKGNKNWWVIGLNSCNDELFTWCIEEGALNLKTNGVFYQMIIEILECNETEFQQYIDCLKKDVIMGVLSEVVEEMLDKNQNRVLNNRMFEKYFYSYEEFGESFRSILEYYLLEDEKITKDFDWVFEVCELPNKYIIKQLLMIYGLIICNGYNVSKEVLLNPLNSENLKLKKVRNKNIKFNKIYWEQSDYKKIMNKQTEFTIFLDNLQMNGTYEQQCHKSLNLYYYNLFSGMIDLALFTEVICTEAKYINLFKDAPGFVYKENGIDKNFIKNICESSFGLLEVKGSLLKEHILKRKIKSYAYQMIDEEDIVFFNDIFKKCKLSLKNFLYQIDHNHLDEEVNEIKKLDYLFAENAYDELFRRFIDRQIITDFYEVNSLKMEKDAHYYIKKEVYYNLYKLFSEYEQMNAKLTRSSV